MENLETESGVGDSAQACKFISHHARAVLRRLNVGCQGRSRHPRHSPVRRTSTLVAWRRVA
ncbi:MAG: hypothetical protein ABI128_09845, partial [Rhodanobacter sp.]